MVAERSYVLAIDTSGSFCSVVLRQGSNPLVTKTSEGEGDHFEQLPILVADIFDEVPGASNQLAEVRIGLGPGSFTGLRIGLGFAKGLVSAERIPLIGISSFFACALATKHQIESSKQLTPIGVVSDARRGEVFWATYEASRDGSLTEVNAPAIVPVSTVEAWKEKNTEGMIATPLRGFCVTGVGDIIVQDHIGIGLIHATISDIPQASAEQWAVIEPQYIRPVAAKTIEERTRD